MRKYFYDVVVRRYKKDLRNAFSHFSDLFIFHMIFLFIRQNFPVFLHCANPRYLCHMQIFADTFYQQIMLGYMIQTGDCNRSDHTTSSTRIGNPPPQAAYSFSSRNLSARLSPLSLRSIYIRRLLFSVSRTVFSFLVSHCS